MIGIHLEYNSNQGCQVYLVHCSKVWILSENFYRNTLDIFILSCNPKRRYILMYLAILNWH